MNRNTGRCEQESRDLWPNYPVQLGRQRGEENPFGGTGNCVQKSYCACCKMFVSCHVWAGEHTCKR